MPLGEQRSRSDCSGWIIAEPHAVAIRTGKCPDALVLDVLVVVAHMTCLSSSAAQPQRWAPFGNGYVLMIVSASEGVVGDWPAPLPTVTTMTPWAGSSPRSGGARRCHRLEVAVRGRLRLLGRVHEREPKLSP